MAYKRRPESETADGGTFLTEIGGDAIRLAIEAFSKDIRNSGVGLAHYTAIPCAVGRIRSTDTLSAVHSDHVGCQNGHIYLFEGYVTALFTGNSKRESYDDVGRILGSTAQVTFPTHYDDKPNKPVVLSPFDRLTFAEPPFQVVYTELIDANETGRDRLKFPPVAITHCIDNRGIRYTDADYHASTDTGEIVWLGQHRPGIDPDTGNGRVYSIRYLYNPHYYVESLGHEVRVLPSYDENGQRITVQMPRQVTLSRENTFRSADNDPDSQAKDAESQTRQAKAPPSGSFNPR